MVLRCELHAGVVAEHDPGGSGCELGPHDFGVLADQRVVEPTGRDHAAAGRAAPSARAPSRRSRSRMRRTCTDRCSCRRRACRAPMIAGPRTVERTISAPASTTTRPSITRRIVDRRRRTRRDRVEHQPVALEQRILLAGVDPPALQDLVADAQALVDEPLDGIGDLELAARRRLDRPHRVVDARTEQVDARRWPGRTADPAASRRAARPRRRGRGRPHPTDGDPRRGRAGAARRAHRGAAARSASNAVTSPSSLCCSMLSPR